MTDFTPALRLQDIVKAFPGVRALDGVSLTVLPGEVHALMGENDTLRKRASQFFERLETQVRQTLKEGEIRQGLRPRTTSARGADFVLVFVEGRIQRFIRSSFSRLPSTDFDESWGLVAEGVWG